MVSDTSFRWGWNSISACELHRTSVGSETPLENTLELCNTLFVFSRSISQSSLQKIIYSNDWKCPSIYRISYGGYLVIRKVTVYLSNNLRPESSLTFWDRLSKVDLGKSTCPKVNLESPTFSLGSYIWIFGCWWCDQVRDLVSSLAKLV